MIFLDFETRSEADTKRCGAWKYSLDPSTEINCIAWLDDDIDECVKSELNLYSVVWPSKNLKISAHNAGFEFAIWNNICVPKYKWPYLPIENWYCTAARSVAVGLPRSLDNAASALNLDEQKDNIGKQLMLKMCKPRPKWTKNRTGPKWFDDPKDLDSLKKYCEQDVKTTVALSKKIPDLSPSEREIWLTDQKINLRGIFWDVDLVRHAAKLAEKEIGTSENYLRSLSDGTITSPNQVARILKFAQDRGYEFNDLSKTSVAPSMENLPDDSNVKKILQVRQALSKSSVGKFQAILDRVCEDGRSRDNLMYYGARTGRWTSSGIQIQNLIRPSIDMETIRNVGRQLIIDENTELINFLFKNLFELLSSSIRSSVIPGPGNRLMVADYASIEPRITFWLVNHTEMLDKINRGYNIYKTVASEILGKPYDSIDKKSKDGQLGKQAGLGLIYQMGPFKFLETCRKYKIDIDDRQSYDIVHSFRYKYKSICNYWKDQNREAIETVFERKEGPNYRYDAPFLFSRLPSGREISYPYPEIRINKFNEPTLSYMGVHPITKKWTRLDTYGGKLTENRVQGIARDILTNGMLSAEKKGYRIISTVHDEIIAEVPKTFGSVEEFTNLLCCVPDWAIGCPVSAEGWTGDFYWK